MSEKVQTDSNERNQKAQDDTDEQRLKNVMDAIADSIIEADDDELAEESSEGGLSPVEEAEKVRRVLLEAAYAEIQKQLNEEKSTELKLLPSNVIHTVDKG